MAFRDFTYPNVLVELGLAVAEGALFDRIEPLDLPAAFVERMRANVDLAVALNTEKARSEFIVAPLLLELKFGLGRRFGLFSGVELDVDTSRGLNGYCDFVLTRSALQTILSAPVLAVVEAKNDNLRSGLGQCIAATVAAREFNALEGRPAEPVYGAVTTGTAWQFLRLDGASLTIEVHEYPVSEPGRILAILSRIVA
jgi:hypothetical protein